MAKTVGTTAWSHVKGYFSQVQGKGTSFGSGRGQINGSQVKAVCDKKLQLGIGSTCYIQKFIFLSFSNCF